MQSDGRYRLYTRRVLTAQERNVLYWTAEGKTQWEISIILGIAETTVKTHLKNSRIKLEASNKTHTVVKAIRQSELPLFDRLNWLTIEGKQASAIDSKNDLNARTGSRVPSRGVSHPQLAKVLQKVDEWIKEAHTPVELFAALDRGCTVLGFDAVMLSCHKSTKEALLLNPTYSTIPLDVMRVYKRLNWIENDVLLPHIIGGSRAFIWDSTFDRYRDPRGQGFLQFLKRFRLATGILVPLEDEEGFKSFVSLHAYFQTQFDLNLIDAVEAFGKNAKKKADELGI